MAKMSLGRYAATRITTLRPTGNPLPNPFTTLRLLTWRQWKFFLIAFIAWTWDAFDFFTVSITLTDLAKSLNVSKKDISWGITLVLMFRSVGAITFGIAADKWGRKWPFIINNVLFIIFELLTGFVTNYKSFLIVRAFFGIAMGGIYGNCAATALEDAPPEARGILSGMLQQGYAFGYLLAAVFARALAHDPHHGWRPLFWFGACPPALFILWRLFLPETDAFQARQALRLEAESEGVANVFIKEAKVGVRRHWLTLIYLVLLMAGFNFMSHGSQDLYPTLLQSQLGFSTNRVTITQVVANLGAMLGGTTVGYVSQSLGRRFTIIVTCILGGALVYPYTYVRSDSIMAAAFFTQFMVQGAWGVIPIHLMELSPPSMRTFVVGTSYQLGNLVSSASSTIETTIGDRFPLPPLNGSARYDYGKVMALFMGAVFAYVILLTFIGPEHLNRDLAAVEPEEDVRPQGGKMALEERENV
ncbi:major facilitator superfamily domain-containing protein [Sphaerosporella brunnea]|uniref:Major facilitator superfamily domain-containing protein n=1 Tax=Sphaerosporella brunnea TaxID=1250544 RepID=A0A5J5EQ55_9PEZI|nr:major facilitator superfamily domain-containing protein [Sphaerosporella brunnea]